MPTARKYFAAVAVARKVYAIGGFDDAYEFCDAVEAYDPLSGAWTQVASLPVARGYHTAAVVDGIKIYVLDGIIYDDEDEREATGRVDVYHPAADSWQQMAAMPTARETNAAAVMDGKIYVSGGFTTSRELSDAFEAYDPVTNTWTTLR
jgi:N-acetylneuraminic acid mutarotase